MVPDPELDPDHTNTARRYGYWVGGKDHFRADRESSSVVEQVLPNMIPAAREGRNFVLRAVTHLARDRGIRQFFDVGAGWPLEPSVHEIAQHIDPTSRIVYVDIDKVAEVYHDGMTISSPEGRAAFHQGDLLEPAALLAGDEVRAVLDFDQPVALLLCSILHLIPDDDAAYQAVQVLVDALAPGSFVAVAHGTFDTMPEATRERVQALMYSGQHGSYRARDHAGVLRFFDGLAVQEPGLVSSVAWRPEIEPRTLGTSEQDAMCWVGVGVKR